MGDIAGPKAFIWPTQPKQRDQPCLLGYICIGAENSFGSQETVPPMQLPHQYCFCVDRQPGIYVLLMHLSAERRIKIGALGKQDLAPGWYAYVGSAHGPGGLKRRVDRHKARQKTLRSHIDYLAAAAEISEIWFAHAERDQEHDWVAILADLKDAEFPITGFGSQDCRSVCHAHLLHFKQRPIAATLRAELSRRHRSDLRLWVDFVEPPFAPADAAASATPLMQSYLRGQHYLEIRRNHGNGDGQPIKSTATLGDASAGRQPLVRLAGEWGVEASELKKDVEFAKAVEQIIENCGSKAAEVLFDPVLPQHRKSIMQISRTSRERQRFRIAGVAARRMRSVAPQGSDYVPDTVSFREVVSRLERARGAVEISLRLLTSRTDDRQASNMEIMESVKAIQEQVALLKSVLAGLETVDRPTPRKTSKHNRPPGEAVARLQLHQVPRQLKAAVKLVAKNVRDLPALSSTTNLHDDPASSYDLRPTAEELRRAQLEIRRISIAAEGILQTLSDG